MIKGIKENGTSSIQCLYSPDDDEEKDVEEHFLYEMKIDDTIPNLLKKQLATSRKRDAINLTFESNDKPLRISSSISNIGKLTFYIYPIRQD